MGITSSFACGEPAADDCPTGSRGCACTVGGGCDPGLDCIDSFCIFFGDTNDAPGTESGGDPSGSPTSSPDTTATTMSPSTTADDTAGTESGTGDGPKLDVGNADSGGPVSGCAAIDVLFVLDSSGSMLSERQALAATNAFTQIVTTLEGLNGGGIDYRIGVTDDNDHGFFTPAGWLEPEPWFDSADLDVMATAQAFNGAVAQINNVPATPAGCEHVLSSATDLLVGDATGFVREDALLVLVLVTDVDDYGYYDQLGWSPDQFCALFGCSTAPSATPVELATTLLDQVKGGQESSVAAIVVAGDPGVAGGVNTCQQPGSCCGGGDCDVYHSPRLWEFAATLGGNGYAANLCDVTVPAAVQTALTESIDLACMNFEPEG